MPTIRNFVFAAFVALNIASVAHSAPAPIDYHAITTISLPGAESWDYISVDANSHRLFVSRQTHVAVIDTITNKVVGDIPNTDGVHGIAFDDADNLGFITCGRSNTLKTFNLTTLATVRETPTGKKPDGLVYDPFSGRVFVFEGASNSVSAIIAKTGAVAGIVALPGKPEFPATDNAGHIYDNIEDMSEIVSINAKTLNIDATWPVAPGTGPSGLAIDAATHRLFSTCGNNQLAIVDTTTGKVVATPAIGNGPDAVVYDPALHLVFVPAGRDGTITILRETSPDQYDTVGTLTTQSGARTIALDTKLHRVYTVTAKRDTSGNAPAGGRGGKLIDGTFVVLVYGEGK